MIRELSHWPYVVLISSPRRFDPGIPSSCQPPGSAGKRPEQPDSVGSVSSARKCYSRVKASYVVYSGHVSTILSYLDSSKELSTIGRFLAREGCEEALEAAIRESWAPARAEPGCVRIEWFRSIRNPRLFFVHSRWADEAAFEIHAELPHTVTFIEKAERLMDHPLDVTRIRALDEGNRRV